MKELKQAESIRKMKTRKEIEHLKQVEKDTASQWTMSDKGTYFSSQMNPMALPS